MSKSFGRLLRSEESRAGCVNALDVSGEFFSAPQTSTQRFIGLVENCRFKVEAGRARSNSCERDAEGDERSDVSSPHKT
jgi:hypothetical protein